MRLLLHRRGLIDAWLDRLILVLTRQQSQSELLFFVVVLRNVCGLGNLDSLLRRLGWSSLRLLAEALKPVDSLSAHIVVDERLSVCLAESFVFGFALLLAYSTATEDGANAADGKQQADDDETGNLHGWTERFHRILPGDLDRI